MKPPRELRVTPDRRQINITTHDGRSTALDAEYLRVYSPSAEVRGHGPDDKVLQTGKRLVEIANIEPVGNYAVRIAFSDGHDTGLYTWSYLQELTETHEEKWKTYLRELAEAGASRDQTTL